MNKEHGRRDARLPELSMPGVIETQPAIITLYD